MNLPTMKFPPYFQTNGPVDPDLFVGRDEQLREAMNGIARSEQLLIVGPRKAGKTSFLHKVHKLVSEQNPRVFVLWFDLQIYHNNELAEFTRLLALELIKKIWTQIHEKTFSELMEAVKRPPSLRQQMNKELKVLVDSYRLLKSSRTQASFEHQSTIGANLPISAEANESRKIGHELMPLENSEVLATISDLVDRCLIKFEQILVLADETSSLPMYVPIDTLNRYLEILRDSRFQFVFSGVPFGETEKSFMGLSVICDHTLQLGRFANSEPIKELIKRTIEKYIYETGERFAFDDDCAEKVFLITKGVPHKAQQLLGKGADIVWEKGSKVVMLNDIVDAATELLPIWDQNRYPGLVLD